jgi:RimJ/RimL family protein N-acetyltransferase
VRLETERLVIEPLGLADVDGLVAYRIRPEVARFQSWGEDYSRDDAIRLVETQPALFPGPGEWLQLAMHDGDRLVGDLAVHTLADQPDSYELGVTLDIQGQGYATEGLRALVAHLFDRHGAHRVMALSDARNERVAALLGRVGFRHEGRAIQADWFKGEWTTLDSWAILRGEPFLHSER